MTSKKICHLTVLHFRYDLRIVTRECLSLVQKGYDVHYILNDGRGQEAFEGLHIHDLNAPTTALKRFTKTHYNCLRKALSLQANVYHFHDPELMIVGLILKILGKKVIADIHEDIPNQIKGSIKKNKFNRHLFSSIISRLEKWILPFLDAVITSSPFVENKLRPFSKKIVNIACFPDLRTEFSGLPNKGNEKYDLVYTGSISPLRGIIETLDVIEKTDINFALAGDFQGKNLEKQLKEKPAWRKNTTYLGYIENRLDYVNLLYNSKIGLTTLQYNPSFEATYCIKMFEYMAAGIPQISTNFDYWKKWFTHLDCIIFVDPTNEKQVKSAITYLLSDPENAQRMGKNGREAVENLLNWQSQEKKLFKLYKEILEQ